MSRMPKIIFTHGFIKKEQKTPDNEIEKAILIRKVFRGGNEYGTEILRETIG
jgi:hypothetical protein